MLRLVSTTVGPVSIATGTNGGVCGDCVIEAYNAGDGTMNLTATATDPATGNAVSWVQPSIGAARACRSTNLASTCLPITMTLNTAALPAGTATANVTISDPKTADAPQVITVVVQMGGGIPNTLPTQYVAPGGTALYPVTTNSNIRGIATTQDKNNWLSLQVAVTGQGSFTFVYPWTIQVQPQSANAPGTYTGSLAISGSSFAGDNKNVAVTMNVTTQPIAQVSSQVLNIRLAQGAPQYVTGVAVTNSGQGTLTVQSVSGTGGSWLSASQSGNTAIATINPASLAVGSYQGSLTIASNAVNPIAPIPVNLQIVANGTPYIPFQQVVDGATFTPGDAVSPGDVVTIFGEQLSYAGPALGGAPPLPTTLSTTQVFVNGQAAPLFYSSYNQINFQMPSTVPAGNALVTVVRDGQTSNAVSLGIASRAPRVLLFGSSGFGAIVNNDGCRGQTPCLLGGSLPFTADQSQPGYPAYPARAGDVLTIYAIGMGATSPSVASGQASPSAEPFARLVTTPQVRFGDNPFAPMVTPSFAALSPGFAGLYQINVAVPQDTQKGLVNVSVIFPDSSSNPARIAIQ